jgi:hypothetical protein
VSAEFEQLVDLEGLGPVEVSRLRRMHDLLVAAGPPVDLPAALTGPPTDLDGTNVIALPPRRRKPAALVLLAAAIAAACFGGGYVLANQAHHSSIDTIRVVPLKGEQNSFASLRVGSADSDGNWPVVLTVTGLKHLSNAQAHYVLMLWDNGKPSAVCGMFKVGKNGDATVTFNVPYTIGKSTRWVVTEMAPGVQFPGHVVMTMS